MSGDNFSGQRGDRIFVAENRAFNFPAMNILFDKNFVVITKSFGYRAVELFVRTDLADSDRGTEIGRFDKEGLTPTLVLRPQSRSCLLRFAQRPEIWRSVSWRLAAVVS